MNKVCKKERNNFRDKSERLMKITALNGLFSYGIKIDVCKK
jgi:hypothetical protein